MDKVNDGGMAFPTNALRDENGNVVQHAMYGMTLRDYFAGQAITGIVTNGNSATVMAVAAYRLADAMIAARESN